MKIFNFSFPIFVKDLKLSNDYINTVKNKSLTKYEFNKNNFFEKNDDYFSSQTNQEIKNYLLKILKNLNLNEYKIKKIWVQKYNKNNFHDCHIHNPTEFSFILYVDCTDNSSETIFYNVGYPYFLTGNFRVKPKIGRCVVFHGALPHCALPNKDDKRLIVSGNILFS
jgi:hypothetical protein